MTIRFVPISVALILVHLTIPRASAQASPSVCSFNSQEEPCIVTRHPDNTYRVKWLSDGKIINYSYFNCQPNATESADRCEVRIIEDTGRVSMGVAEIGGRGSWIESSNGNTTLLPIPPL